MTKGEMAEEIYIRLYIAAKATIPRAQMGKMAWDAAEAFPQSAEDAKQRLQDWQAQSLAMAQEARREEEQP